MKQTTVWPSSTQAGACCFLAFLLALLEPAVGSEVACGEPGRVFVSNPELVSVHRRIVVADAIAQEPGDRPYQTKYRFALVEVVKGSSPAAEFSILGTELPSQGELRYMINDDEVRDPAPQTHSPRGDFSVVRDAGGVTSCAAPAFREGMRYLLFLDPAVGRESKIRLSNLRRFEALHDADDPWLIAVKDYVRISEGEDRSDGLRELRKTYSSMPTMHGAMDDIDRHFNTPSLLKSVGGNLSLYERLSEPDLKGQALSAVMLQDSNLAKRLIGDAIGDGSWKTYSPLIAGFVMEQKLSQYVPYFLRFLNHEITQHEWTRPMGSAISIVARLADASHLVQMESILRGVRNQHQRSELAQWFIRYPSDDAKEIIRSHVESADSHVGFKLNWVLAAMGDPLLLSEVIQEIDAESIPDDMDQHRWQMDHKWENYYFIATAPISEAPDVVRRIIAKGNDYEIGSLIQGVMESQSPHKSQYIDWLKEADPSGPQSKTWMHQLLSRISDE